MIKIIANDAIYVQKIDIAYLDASNLPIPASIFMKTVAKGMTINENNKYDFIRFDEASEIEYFKGLDCIIDCDVANGLSEEEIIEAMENVQKERLSIAREYNSMSIEERRLHPDMVRRCELLEIKYYSLGDLLLIKQRNIALKLPESTDVPIDPEKRPKL